MAKTIDVEGWPPAGKPGGAGRKPSRRRGFGAPPLMVKVAASLFALLVIAGALMALTGRLGVARIKPEEVGVLVNYLTGSEEVIQQPGYRIYLPFVQEVYTFDRTTQQFLMEGQRYVHDNHVPLLTVRAGDGSNFRIDDLTILYEIVPGDASIVLHDSGPGTGFKEEWIKAYARSALRDEFGRYSAVEVADPTVYKAAPAAAAARLQDLLKPHGVRIVRINTPNPQFDLEYENAIEQRKEADQEVERLIAEAERLEQLRAQYLAAVEKEKEVEQQRLMGDLRRELLAAEENRIAVEKSADVYATERIAEGRALMAQLTNEARGLEAKYTKEAEGIAARAHALEQRGEVVVREAIIQKLASITFTLLPYSRDPVPRQLEHVNLEDEKERVENALLGGGSR